MPANHEKQPDTKQPSFAKEPPKPQLPEWRVALWVAWDSWLKNLLFVALAIMAVALFLFGLIPPWILGSITVVAVLVIPTALIAIKLLRYKENSKARTMIWSVFLLAVFAVAAYPPIATWLGNQQTRQLTFQAEGDKQELSGLDPSSPSWLFEVQGKLKQTDKPSSVSYSFSLHDKNRKQNIKGSLKRSWSKVRVGYKTKGKKLTDQNHKVHMLSANFGENSKLELTHLAGKMDGPLEVILRPEPVTWLYLLSLEVPLLFLGGILDESESDKKRGIQLTSQATFLMTFATIFADNWMPGVWFNAVMLAILCAVAASLILGFLVPRLMRPFARRFSH